MPAPKPSSRPRRRHAAINLAAASRIASVILTARSAGSEQGTGSLKNTMIPSPENWSSVPSNWLTSGPNNVEDPFLLVERRYRLRSNDLPARRVHGLERDVFVHHANRVCDQIAAIVDLGHNPIGVVFAVKHDRFPRPLDRREAPGAVIQHIAAPVVIPAGDDHSGFVRLLAGGNRRIDRHDNARQIRHRFPYWPAQFFEQPARPQCARYIVEDLGLDLLPP